MIGTVHTAVILEQIRRSEQELAGWRSMLKFAEQMERVTAGTPDAFLPQAGPMTTGSWPPPPPLLDMGGPVHVGRAPYDEPRPSGAFPAIDGSLPPRQEDAFDKLQSAQREDAASPESVREQQKWERS